MLKSTHHIQYFCVLLMMSAMVSCASVKHSTDVLVIGGGTGGTAAGIQSARMGTNTIIAEPTAWLGGMISAAGVSATDGNHKLPSGLWNEFRNQLYNVYGGPAQVETGWVSNTLFEPHIADSLFKSMAAKEPKLKVLFNYELVNVKTVGNAIKYVVFKNKVTGKKEKIFAQRFIDATELGDVIKLSGQVYDLGMEDQAHTGEDAGVHETNDIVQDLTYVAILKDFGAGADKTIPKPAGYTPDEFDGSSKTYYKDTTLPPPTVPAAEMLDYGKLPNGKYMLNWPLRGNDTYLNNVEMSFEEREKSLDIAKQTTLRFVYFIQHQLGFKHLGLADDEFPTADKLALIPYYREGRRVKGLVRFTLPYIKTPFATPLPLYRTGISVGDYPVDHHHKKNPVAPQHLEFARVPSYNVPLGTLVPNKIQNLVIAEKGISVSNVVNGTTRLQPCVLLTGQAAGLLAAMSVQESVRPSDVPVRHVQEKLLKAGAYIMPYIDVKPNDKHFEAIQKVGATGILRGTGIPYRWANQTWFYPDSVVMVKELLPGIKDFGLKGFEPKAEVLTIAQAVELTKLLNPKAVIDNKYLVEKWKAWGFQNFNQSRAILRGELAVLINDLSDPFSRPIDMFGNFIK